ncbi:phage baseplate assembly protein V [Dankookia sp. P2]|uniref:phage baseplate assembly protein V n=1 Tax=Dankookia sp. P2 TaxID=3423955 RepID=UPI003D674ACA
MSRVDMLGWRSDSLEALRGIAGDRALPLGEDAVRFLPDRMLGGGPQGQALAQATMDRAQAAGTTAEGLADGNPALAPGCRILIKAPMADRDGPFVVTRAVHRFTTTEGYTTEFGTAPPPARDRERRPVVTIGRVSSISDPDEAGRCRARLPGFADLESGWLQLVVPGAGKGRGLACLPEVEDAVLILLPDGDPAQGFVLGGLWGRDRLPRGVNLKQKRPFVLRTAGGQGLELGHDAALARLSTASGSVVELAPNRLRIAAATDLLIEAPGKSVTIRANAIDFEQA